MSRQPIVDPEHIVSRGINPDASSSVLGARRSRIHQSTSPGAVRQSRHEINHHGARRSPCGGKAGTVQTFWKASPAAPERLAGSMQPGSRRNARPDDRLPQNAHKRSVRPIRVCHRLAADTRRRESRWALSSGQVAVSPPFRWTRPVCARHAGLDRATSAGLCRLPGVDAALGRAPPTTRTRPRNQGRILACGRRALGVKCADGG
jgi:hypothetical protein